MDPSAYSALGPHASRGLICEDARPGTVSNDRPSWYRWHCMPPNWPKSPSHTCHAGGSPGVAPEWSKDGQSHLKTAEGTGLTLQGRS